MKNGRGRLWRGVLRAGRWPIGQADKSGWWTFSIQRMEDRGGRVRVRVMGESQWTVSYSSVFSDAVKSVIITSDFPSSSGDQSSILPCLLAFVFSSSFMLTDSRTLFNRFYD